MKVGHRINARKVVLSYFYQRCFFHNLSKQDNNVSTILSVDNIFSSQKEQFEEAKSELMLKIKNELEISDDENLEYFVNIFFDKRPVGEIDMDYVFAVGKSFEKYFDEAIENINKHTQSFSFSEMNTMNQTLFLLGYVEWKVLQTPKEVLLNELIELAKRYDDEGSPKLINGIMHKVFNNIQE
ncbi:MAG TPA: transcription antitermination factor NusB [Candidatus Absconditabacterales bacterium]|nr:transcription antitermination factor NusB [Candidatus Absconditabacterales bacterium]